MNRTNYKNWYASIFEMFLNDTLVRTDKLNDNCINSSDDCSRVQIFETRYLNEPLIRTVRKQWQFSPNFPRT